MNRLFLLLFLAANAAGDDWPQFRGPNRDGVSRERGIRTQWPPEGPAHLWNQEVGAGGSSIAVADGKAYTMGNVDNTDVVYCFDAETGKLIWKHSYPAAVQDINGFLGPRATPMIDGDRVYTVSRDGQLFCLNTRTGLVIWSGDYRSEFKGKMPVWGWWGTPVIDGDALIAEVGGGKGTPLLVAMDKRSGSVLWTSGGGMAGYASPVTYGLKGDRFVLTFSAAGLEARRVIDGKLAWSHPWRTSYDMNSATPIVVGDRVFVSSAYRVGGALLDISGPKPLVIWEQRQMAVHMNGAVYWGGHLYGFDESTVRCVEFQTGAIKWSVDKFRKGSLMVADGKLIILAGDGQLAVADTNPKAYKELAICKAISGRDLWAPPVLANGLIYLRGRDTLHCMDLRGGENKSALWADLFPENGIPKGWKVREWSDIRRPGPPEAKWEVINGTLVGSEPRGTWLVSDQEYGDFELEFEWRIGKRGNSGVGLRFPDFGDPAFDGLELQMVDPRYYPPEMKVPPNELTGGLYRGVAPSLQLFKPEEWNKYYIRALGANITVNLNGERILDVNLSEQTTPLLRHSGEDADPLRDRPRKGHIGFQELSREGGRAEIRKARIRVLD